MTLSKHLGLGIYFTPKVVISLIVLLLPAVVMAYSWAVLPFNSDDIWYIYRPTRLMEEGYPRWEANLSEFYQRMMTDNGRLGNFFFLITYAWVPKPLVASVLGVFIFLSLYLMVKLSGGNLNRPLIACAIVLIYTHCLKWLHDIYSIDYALNYVPSLLLMVVVVYLFLQIDTLSKKRRIILYTCALLTGWWHEAAALSLVAGVAVYMLLRRRATRREWYLLAFLCAGLLIIFSMPGPWFRAFNSMEIKEDWTFRIKKTVLLALMLVPISIWFCVKDYRKTKTISKTTAYISMCATGLLVAHIPFIVIRHLDRPLFFGMLLCALGWMVALQQIFSKKRLKKIWWLSLPLAAVLAYHYVWLGINSHDVAKIFEPTFQQYLATDEKYIFTDFEKPRRRAVLWEQKYLPDALILHGGYTQLLQSLHYKDCDRKTIFFPKALADVDVSPGKKVPGDTPLYVKQGWLYTEYTDSTAGLLKQQFYGLDNDVLEVNPDTFHTATGKTFIFIDYFDLDTPTPSAIYF